MAADQADKVWNLIEKIPICMLVTHDGVYIRARPMSAYVRRDENAVYFLTDTRRHKDEEIARDPRVCLAFVDSGDQAFVSISGVALVLNDRAKIKELWSLQLRHGGTAPTIRRSACCASPRTMPSTGIRRARWSAMSRWPPRR